VSHEKEMLLDKDVVNYIPQIRLILAKYMGITHPADLPPVQLIFEMFGKVKCNSYGILDEDMVISGVGIYLNSSLFDHSCQPNACQVFDGPRLFIRATEDIHQISQVIYSLQEVL
jgi:SET domain